MLKSKRGIIYYDINTISSDIVCFTAGGRDFALSENQNLSDNYANYRVLTDVFNLPSLPFTVNQIHSANIYNYDNKDKNKAEGYDGIITSHLDLPLGILTADCFSVQLIGGNNIANLHCGWRSIYAGIINNAVDIFQGRGDKIDTAVVNIGICTDCYEVSPGLVGSFIEKFQFNDIYKEKDGSCYLNLRKIIENILKFSGVNRIIHLQRCTFCNKYLYSYRRDGEKTGRLLSVIMRKS
ncbi:MAG TPA: hypothetical protein DHM44_02705 [Flexistipes sinusarabici]|uniref:Purine nucleoside phosphorylase n=1 Tax=Flexistipes sinusarabici TaxID=2352 RepID=A0A3D5QA86_FLESI|nr:hypothetical protein [Flexistipes sinusarabici]